MSLKKSATRRLSLLAGSSLVAAGLATAAFTGVSLAPGQAFAYDECTPVAPTLSDGPNGVSDPTLNGATADTFTCTGATFSTTGITYSSNGNLRANATGAIDVGAVGINLTGTGADTVTLSSTGALTGSTGPVVDLKSVDGAIAGTTAAVTATAGNAVLIGATGTGGVTYTATGALTGTSGAILDIKTASGSITATTAGVTATAAGVTGAVRLESTGAGNITYTKTGTNTASAINSTAAGADAAIAAITHGGNITMTINTGSPSFGSSVGVAGRLRGLVAETSGAGSVVLNVIGVSGVVAGQTDGVVAVDIAAGTGGADINLSTGGIGGRIDRSAPNTVDRIPYTDALAIRIVSAGAVTIDNTGGRIVGAVDFSDVSAGGVRFENSGTGSAGSGLPGEYASGGVWHMSGDSVFTSQDDTLIMGGTRLNNALGGSTVDFGAGNDTFSVSGIFGSNGVTISNLETFNNSGTIYFGVIAGPTGTPFKVNDRADDYLSMGGANFTGSGSSHLLMDVVLSGTAQVGCETLSGVADCLDLRDGTTAGSTVIRINDASPDAMLSGYDPVGITLVDVSGSGSSAASHFTLDPASTNGYVHPVYGAAFNRPGGFVHIFRYDEENQRHVLVGQPRTRDLFDYAILPAAAQSIWHMTSGAVTGRQADLRDGSEVGGLWLRTAGEVTRRDVTTTFDGWDGPVTFDNSYNLYAGTIMGGADVINASVGEFDYVLGGQIGYVSSSLEMDESESSGRFTGATGGLYGGLWSDWFFLDGAVNVNGLALDYKHPALGSMTTTYINSVGAAAETGVRASLTQNTFAEPMASVSWVRTSFEEISLAEGEVEPADAESLRAALGLRLGATLAGEAVSASYFVTGRGWYEFEGETGGVVHNPGVDMPFADEFTGAFGEAELGVNIYNASNTFSGFATTGVKWKKGYSAVDLALGVRMAW